MRETIDGLFFDDYSGKNKIRVQGELVKNLGNVGKEGEIGFYRIKPNEDVCVSQVCVKWLDPDSMSQYPESRPNEVIKKYHILKLMGLPVARFMLASGENNMIMMPDLEDNGRCQIIDKHNPNDGKTVINLKEIQERLLRIANFAYDCNFYLDLDAYMLVLDKSTYLGYPYFIDIGAKSGLIKNGQFWTERESCVRQTNFFLEKSKLYALTLNSTTSSGRMM